MLAKNCYGSQDSPISIFCDGVQTAAASTLSEIASSMFGTIVVATSTTTTRTISTSSTSSTNTTSSLTSAASSTTGASVTNPAWAGPEDPNPVATLNYNQKLGLGLGLGIGTTLVFISSMTLWAMVSKRRLAPAPPPKDWKGYSKVTTTFGTST